MVDEVVQFIGGLELLLYCFLAGGFREVLWQLQKCVIELAKVEMRVAFAGLDVRGKIVAFLLHCLRDRHLIGWLLSLFSLCLHGGIAIDNLGV